MEETFKLQYTQIASGLEWYQRVPDTHQAITDVTNKGLSDIMGWAYLGDLARMSSGIDYFQERMGNLSGFLDDVTHGRGTFIDIFDTNNNLVGKTSRRAHSNISFAVFEPPAQYDTLLQDWKYKKLVILNIEDCTPDGKNNFKIIKNLLFYGNHNEDITPQDLDLYIIAILEQVILSGHEVKDDPDIMNKILEQAIKKALEKIRDKIIKSAIKYFRNLALEYVELEGGLIIAGSIVGALVYLLFDYIIYLVSKMFLPPYCQTTLYINQSKYPFEAYLGYAEHLDRGMLPSQWVEEGGTPLLIDAMSVATSFNSRQISAKTNLTLYEALTVGFSIICNKMGYSDLKTSNNRST